MTPRADDTPYARTIEGKRIYIYARDHGPPHAHVRLGDGPDGVVRFDLDAAEPLANFRCTRKALRAWASLREATLPCLPEMRVAFDRLNPPTRRGEP